MVAGCTLPLQANCKEFWMKTLYKCPFFAVLLCVCETGECGTTSKGGEILPLCHKVQNERLLVFHNIQTLLRFTSTEADSAAVHYLMQTMRVIFLLCVAFALSVASDPVKEIESEPVEKPEPEPIQQYQTKEKRGGELLRKIAGRMTEWQVYPTSLSPDYNNWDYDCPYNWQRYGSRCFIFINSPMAWIDAEKQCWHYGANLASIHDLEEYSFIQDLLMNNGYYDKAWIGGTDAVRKLEWLWSDGSAFDVENWSQNELSNLNRWKKCLTIEMNNWYCEKRLPFVCGTRPQRLY
ncbi:killer cell lectin-like receptor 5 isoform X2 [Morone saxatilis]|uniref:killer cell lectin-like receptor 5 isoform X2 n=1 Tax=Morone saxatilis TaxID=34816 RepID=UPI0015E23422|nr:killer cell lectin-like receptor 5 isoform X2 [Morone saxatilis]